jgi:hypothetical protein
MATLNIATNRTESVTYHWIKSDGATSASQTATIFAGKPLQVSDPWTFKVSFTGWEQLLVTDGEGGAHQSAQLNFTINCLSATLSTPTTSGTCPLVVTFGGDVKGIPNSNIRYYILLTFTNTSPMTQQGPWTSGTVNVRGDLFARFPDTIGKSDTVTVALYVDPMDGSAPEQIGNPVSGTITCTIIG